MPIGARFYLAGPTASGKSDLASFLASRWNAEVVNADAFQLYEKLPILTAWNDLFDPKIGQGVEGSHLYGVLPLSEACHAEMYAQMANRVCAEIESKGKRAIVVGGSGLYLKALTHGLSPFPKSEFLRAELATLTAEERAQKLLQLDPLAGERISLQNDRYVTRALEVMMLTGLNVAAQKSKWDQYQPSFQGAVLVPERDWLRERIARRAQRMIEEGVLEEVKDAVQSSIGVTARKAIGFSEFHGIIEGKYTLPEALTLVSHATWQLAKRQRTWFRRETGFETIEIGADANLEALAREIERRFE